MVKNKLVEGVIGEDIDTLVFGGETLVKNFNRSDLATEIKLSALLSSLELSYDQFVDFCILCGCDYSPKIAGIGPVKALAMIKKQGSIEGVIDYINNDDKLRNRHRIPDDFNYLIARRLFHNPEIMGVTLEEL
jgi:flap endonuclease-1